MRHDRIPCRRAARGRLLGVLLMSLVSSASWAAFQYPPLGGRSAAMSGASLPGEGDSTAIFQNAAGVAGLERMEAYALYNQLFAGQPGVDSIGQSFLTAAAPTPWGALSIGLTDFRAAGLMNERVIGVGFSRYVTPSVAVGVTGKYLYHDYAVGADHSTAGDPILANGNSRGAPTFDAGVIAKLDDSLKAGFAVRNVNSPDVGLASVDRVPREYQAGLSYDYAPWRLKTSLDVLYRDNGAGTLRDRATPSLAVEKDIGERVKFRAGATLDQFSAGVGMQFERFGFDYAFILTRNLLTSNAGTHMIGVRYRFGGK